MAYGFTFNCFSLAVSLVHTRGGCSGDMPELSNGCTNEQDTRSFLMEDALYSHMRIKHILVSEAIAFA